MSVIPSCILVDPTVTDVLELSVDPATHSITLHMAATSATAACLLCSHTATRIHSRYHRTLADLPWAQSRVGLDLGVRRFFCDQPECPRRIFTERLPTITAPWARRTHRLATVQQQIGCVAGGAPGAERCRTLACPAGVDLVLTLVRQRPLPDLPTPRVLGVDDFAFRKGQRYGTILVDHERGYIIDLLPDRTPESVAAWLQAHPGIEIVTRDRAEAYALGSTQGAPAAMQVAERWHLIKNVTDAVASVLQEQRAAIQQHLAPASPAAAPAPEPANNPADPAPPPPAVAPTATNERRCALAAAVHELHARGCKKRLPRTCIAIPVLSGATCVGPGPPLASTRHAAASWTPTNPISGNAGMKAATMRVSSCGKLAPKALRAGRP